MALRYLSEVKVNRQRADYIYNDINPQGDFYGRN